MAAMAQVLADSPPTITRPFHGALDTVQTMITLALGDRGERSVLVRTLKDTIVRDLTPKDYLGELLAIRNFAASRVRYSNDALGVEQVKDPQRMVEEINAYGKAVGDCDDIATVIGALTRQLGRETEFVVVGFGAPGNYSHVFTRAKEPRSGRWIVLDPVAGTDEAKMLRRVTTWRSFKVDR